MSDPIDIEKLRVDHMPDLDDPRNDFEPVDLPESLLSANIGGKSCYSPELRARAVFLTTLLGNAYRASKELNVPYRTVHDWTKTDWWAELEARLRNQAAKSLEAKFTNIIRRSLEAIEERLIRGDVKLKGDEVVYQPVSAKDAAVVLGVIYDKRALLKGDPTSRSEKTSTVRDRLKGLASDMEKAAGKTDIKPGKEPGKDPAVKH